MRTVWTGCDTDISGKICNYECGIWVKLFEFPHVNFKDVCFGNVPSLLLNKNCVL